MYKPNFCAECGQRIARTRWRLWTSRRFCTTCDHRFRRRRFLAPLVAGLALFSIGLALGRAVRPAPPPLIVQRGELPPAPTLAAAQTGAQSADKESEADAVASETKAEPKYGPSGTATERPTDPNETIFICGARTQRGTPCKRRVRGTGRCWQHRGLPAILPPSKLVVTEK